MKVYKTVWKKDAKGTEYREVLGSSGEHIRFEVRKGKGENFTLHFGKKQHEEMNRATKRHKRGSNFGDNLLEIAGGSKQ